MYDIEILPIFLSRADSNQFVGKPACNLPKNMGGTKVLMLILYMNQLVVKDMDCPDMAIFIGTLLAS